MRHDTQRHAGYISLANAYGYAGKITYPYTIHIAGGISNTD